MAHAIPAVAAALHGCLNAVALELGLEVVQGQLHMPHTLSFYTQLHSTNSGITLVANGCHQHTQAVVAQQQGTCGVCHAPYMHSCDATAFALCALHVITIALNRQ